MLIDLNITLFLLFNARQDPAAWLIRLASFFAEQAIFIPVTILVICWCWLPSQRILLAKIIATVLITALVVVPLRQLLFFPRPFMIPIGTNFAIHSATSAFPSQHAAFMFAIVSALFGHAFSLPSRKLKGIALLALLWALIISWSRVYLGIHWPLDIVGALFISLVCGYGVAKYWSLIVEPFLPGLLRGYRFLFNPLIKMGLIKY